MMKDKVIITTFTDPMMGLSYECEPIFRKLETHFEGNIEFKVIMSGLVRDVYDFVNPNDLIYGKEEAIKRYNVKLAKIYESEETISNMPINMTNFHLFSTAETSSIPLNLAYKAVQIIDNKKSDLFLYNLRYATIVDCKPTTKLEEIIKVVKKTGIDEEKFVEQYNAETTKKALEKDFEYTRRLGIYTLPAYLIQYKDKLILVKDLIGYDTFASIISKITEDNIKPKKVNISIESIRNLLNKHPIISPIEIREAFDIKSYEEVFRFIKLLIASNEIRVDDVYHGKFIKKV